MREAIVCLTGYEWYELIGYGLLGAGKAIGYLLAASLVAGLIAAWIVIVFLVTRRLPRRVLRYF